MSIFGRISRLFKADVHGILDCLEEPRALLKQAIREMEESIAEREGVLVQMQKKLQGVTQRIQQIKESLVAMAGEIEICFSSGNEVLAKNIVRKKLEADRLHSFHEQARVEGQKECEQLSRELNESRVKLTQIKEKSALFSERESTCTQEAERHTEYQVSEDEVELAFLKEKQKRDSAPRAQA